jgi:hypothetical protein
MLEEEFTPESIILARKVTIAWGSPSAPQVPAEESGPRSVFVGAECEDAFDPYRNGFITHPEEWQVAGALLLLRKIGDAIYNGIVDFIEHFEN